MTAQMALAALVGLVGARIAHRAVYRLLRRTARRWERRALRWTWRVLAGLLLARWLRRPAATAWNRARARRRRRPPTAGDDIYRGCPLSTWAGDPNQCRWCAAPLPERCERWCGPLCRVTAADNHVWTEARDAALLRDHFECQRAGCGRRDRLEVHHAAELALGRHGDEGCWHHLAGLVTLCHAHHAAETARQRDAGLF